MKVTILGLSAILHVPMPQWPATLQKEAPSVVRTILEMIKSFTELKKEIEEAADESEEEEDEDEFAAGDEEDFVDEEYDPFLSSPPTLILILILILPYPHPYPHPLSSQELLDIVSAAEKAQMEEEQGAFGDDEDVSANIATSGSFAEQMETFYGDSDDDMERDDGVYESILDEIDECIFFAEAMEGLLPSLPSLIALPSSSSSSHLSQPSSATPPRRPTVCARP